MTEVAPLAHFHHRFQQVVRLAGKEWRLLARNPNALGTLFLMPAIFVLVMSFTLKNTLIVRVDLPKTGWVLEDSSPAAAKWTSDWLAQHGGDRISSRVALLEALKSREVDAGVIVREPWIGQDGRPRGEQLEVWLGNRVQPAAAARLRAELSFSMVQVQMRIAAAEAGPFASVLLGSSASAELLPERASPVIRYLYEIESGRKITAVQQSVPAWLIFGMFFVVIPVAGVLIQERNEGTLARLATFGVPAAATLFGKLLAYMMLNWVQLALMVIVGRWLVPLLGGDALYLDISFGWFVVMIVATSVAAVGLALLIAAYTRRFDHAAALGSGMNVVLGAIAGVMVPRVLMPPGLQSVSEWSPMGWALDGMQSVFLGDPDAAFILPRAGLLIGFSALCLLLGWLRLRHLGDAR